MLPNFSQYPPQGLMSQFPGLQGAGWPQMSPGLFGQPGAYSGNAPFGYEPGQNQFSLSPFAGYAGVPNPAQQIVLVLGQLAQQISVQSALIQQISIALQQLVHQLAVQSLQSHQGAGLGAGQPLGVGGPFPGSFGGQYFGQNPFASATQGGYGGFGPQAQSWGANRAQTIQ